MEEGGSNFKYDNPQPSGPQLSSVTIVYIYQSDGRLLYLWDKQLIYNQLRVRSEDLISKFLIEHYLYLAIPSLRSYQEN